MKKLKFLKSGKENFEHKEHQDTRKLWESSHCRIIICKEELIYLFQFCPFLLQDESRLTLSIK